MSEAGTPLPLEGVRVLDIATIIAGPGAAARLGDFGADVIKVEHPRGGDTARNLGWTVPESDSALWWKQIGRNKRPITLNLSLAKGQDLLLRLVETADVLIESFRPGTLERWNLGPDRLLERNRKLILLRTSGFGQTGPYHRRPGFGTLAEAMSGYAHMTGFPDGPPVLPPVALADEVAALLGAFSVMVALYHRDLRGGHGQVIDLSLVEALFSCIGPVPAVHEKLGIVPGRLGNRIAYAAPRGAFKTKDGRWIALSGTSQAVAERAFRAMGRPDLVGDPRFATNAERLANVDELDALIAAWTSERTQDEVLAAFDQEQAAAAPVHDIVEIGLDPQYRERGTIVQVIDEDLGQIPMCEVQPRLSETPGRIRHAGRSLGAANEEVYGEIGLDHAQLERLREEEVI
jgi:crotonobetainyl-CoA:carnitine CoA-transferase CaiB-like acyl-CoA transferase